MRSIPALSLGLAMLFLTGCGDATTGGPGAKDGKKGSNSEATFTISPSPSSAKLKQGESKAFEITINRSKNLDEDVRITFADVPTGVSFDPVSTKIKHGDQDAKVTVKVSDTASLGDFTVKLIGHPTNGADATNTFKLTVEKK